MGSYVGRHEHIDENIYALLARDLRAYYLPSLWLEPDFETAISQFKHACYTFAMKAAGFHEYKAIYLNDGMERIAKAFFDGSDERFVVSFISDDIAIAFDKADERLPPGKRTTAWLERRFLHHWGCVSMIDCERKWINLGRESYNK